MVNSIAVIILDCLSGIGLNSMGVDSVLSVVIVFFINLMLFWPKKED